MSITQLEYSSALERTDLLAGTVAAMVKTLDAAVADDLLVAEIDPELADTAAFCEKYGWQMEDSANCVVIAGKRGEEVRYGACIVLATTRADVNGTARRLLGARKASFAPMDDAVKLSGMEYGGITPFGLPTDWPVFVDSRVVERERAVFGSGMRMSKIFAPGKSLLALPSVQVIDGLASPVA